MFRLRFKALFVVSFLAFFNVLSASRCRGGFDLYFVLDKSSSVSPTHFRIQTVTFVENIVEKFVSSKLRVSFITFSTTAKLVMGLTDDRKKIGSGIQDLRNVKTSGDTYMDLGLKLANDQMEKLGERTAGVIIALTDGKIGARKTQTFEQARISRVYYGASVYAVGVDNYNFEELKKIADKPSDDHVFVAQNYDALKSIIDSIIKKSCIEVLSVEPTKICAGERFAVTLHGNGFTKTDNTSNVRCNFKLGEKDQISKATFVDATVMKCFCPAIPNPGSKVNIQVSVNSVKYVSSDVSIEATDCRPRVKMENQTTLCVGESSIITISGENLIRSNEAQSNVVCRVLLNETFSVPAEVISLTPSALKCKIPAFKESGRTVVFQVATSNYKTILRSLELSLISCEAVTKKANVGLIVGILFALFLLALLLLWWFWMVICPKPKEEPVSPTSTTGPPKKKWPSVDTSYYGGGGIGGITPVKVKWGDKGATDAGALLAAAELKKKKDNPSSSEEEPKPSCWEVTKGRLLAFFALFPKAYAWLASKRPRRTKSGGTEEEYKQVRQSVSSA